MRLSFLELEEIRANPKAWALKKNGGSVGPRMGYRGLTKLALYRFHRANNLVEARSHLTNLFNNRGFHDAQRRGLAEMQLESYADWFAQASPIVIDVRARSRVALLDGWFISGEVSRVDLSLTAGGYQAILVGESHPKWRSDLRMPLLQAAVSARYQRDAALISVGVQALDGSNLETHSYSTSVIQQSVDEANAIVVAARKYLV